MQITCTPSSSLHQMKSSVLLSCTYHHMVAHYTCCAHAVLMGRSCCAYAVVMLCSLPLMLCLCSAHAVLMRWSCCAYATFMLCSCTTHAVLMVVIGVYAIQYQLAPSWNGFSVVVINRLCSTPRGNGFKSGSPPVFAHGSFGFAGLASRPIYNAHAVVML